MSQAKLGELVGRSPSTIRSWERDKSSPTDASVLHALSAILGVDERSLFEKAGQEPPPEAETNPTVEEALATLNPEIGEIGEPPSSDEPLDSQDEASQDGLEPESGVEPEYQPAVGATEPDDPAGSDVTPAVEHTSDQDNDSVAVDGSDDPASPGYLAPPEPPFTTSPTPRLAEPSYVEDQGQRQLYRVRSLATLVVVVALTIAFLWALGEGLDAIGSWWDNFFGSLRL